MNTISARIDEITGIGDKYRHTVLPAPKSVKIEITGLCNFRCLRGDTPVDTIYGPIPIKELAENYETIPVYSYKDGEAIITDAINIRKTGANEQLVRVSFDDGTHIDCTPDHKFLQFKSLGSKGGTKEYVTEAKDLIVGTRLRAYRENIVAQGYINICVGRNFRRKQHRLVMDYKLGRKLERTEIVHHNDHDVVNNHPDNLIHYQSMKEHVAAHPEIAERMRTDNPAFNMTPEWRAKITESCRGKTRSLEQRLNYRESKLGEKNPNYIDGKTSGRSRIDEVNHRIESVEYLSETADVYCMEVPETGWFFANKVLVKNCQFCARSLKLRDQKEMDQALFERLLLEMREAGVEEIGLFYLGESFMCKWLEDAVYFAKNVAKFPYVFLTTNGSLATPDRVRALMQNGLDSLKFSLNYADEDQFHDIARVKKRLFHDMIDNMQGASVARDMVEMDTGHRCGLYASYIQYDGEQGERMKVMVDKMTPFVDEIYALPLYNQADFMTEEEKERGWEPTAGNRGRLDALRDPLPCWAVLSEGHITWTGVLSACCFDHDGKFHMGDLTKQSFMEAWNSEKFQELREAHLRKDVTGTVCEHCVIL